MYSLRCVPEEKPTNIEIVRPDQSVVFTLEYSLPEMGYGFKLVDNLNDPNYVPSD